MPTEIQPGPNPAVQSLEMIAQCLKSAETVIKDLHKTCTQLREIAVLQSQRIDNQAMALSALQAMCRNLDARLKKQEGFAV